MYPETPGRFTEPTATEIREHLLASLNGSLRRPGMLGGEIGIQTYLDLVAFACGHRDFLRPLLPVLHRQQRFDPHNGTRGAFERFWGAGTDDMAASVWAEGDSRFSGTG
jgi:hypothetical protein